MPLTHWCSHHHLVFGLMCDFCDIAAGVTQAHVVYSDDTTLAFLDHRPLFFGHTILITQAHYETLTDLPDDSIESFFGAVKLLSEAVVRAMDATGSFVAINNVVSQSVPHLHCHLVPRRFKDGLRGFFWPRTKYADEAEMAEVAERIRAAADELGAVK